jgi:pyruvate dehydrogenase E2 component (dihydrolipoamide acetyltransferase)
MKEITVPDIGDFKDVAVIEVLARVGDTIAVDQTIAVLESDKATVDIPSAESGIVTDIRIKVGDRVSAGSPLMLLRNLGEAVSASLDIPTHRSPAAVPPSMPGADGPMQPSDQQTIAPLARADDIAEASSTRTPAPSQVHSNNVVSLSASVIARATNSELSERIYASPSVRKLARELGVDLRAVKGTGPRGRIIPSDVRGHVKSAMERGAARDGAKERPEVATAPDEVAFSVAPWPQIDPSRFGPVERQPLSRIRKISGVNLHRNWVRIPHVTNHDDADVTNLETFRSQVNRENDSSGAKLSPLAFIMKACVAALKAFPEFNASLEGDTLILKHYYHIGFAADTPRGLVVPVIHNADQKGVMQVAKEMAEIAAKARAGKLLPAEMQGASFSISSLGGIGGTYFTPIINAPEVAILGVGKIQTRVVWLEGQPQPRHFLPLSLSWDHRVVDGAMAGRFNAAVVKSLSDVRRLLL